MSTIRSIFGIHKFEEFTYSIGKKKAVQLRPVSARMSLPGHRWSLLLQEFSQMLCVDQACDQAMSNLSRLLGGFGRASELRDGRHGGGVS